MGAKKSAPSLGRGFEFHQNEFSRKINVVGLHSEVPKVLASQLGYLQGEGARVGGEGLGRCESLPLQTGH